MQRSVSISYGHNVGRVNIWEHYWYTKEMTVMWHYDRWTLRWSHLHIFHIFCVSHLSVSMFSLPLTDRRPITRWKATKGENGIPKHKVMDSAAGNLKFSLACLPATTWSYDYRWENVRAFKFDLYYRLVDVKYIPWLVYMLLYLNCNVKPIRLY